MLGNPDSIGLRRFNSESGAAGYTLFVLVDIELTSRYGHLVDQLYYAVNAADDFGGQVFFSRVPGFAAQLDNVPFRLNSNAVFVPSFRNPASRHSSY
jgi:hypothetical protein